MKESNSFAFDVVTQQKRLNNRIRTALFLSVATNAILALLLLMVLR